MHSQVSHFGGAYICKYKKGQSLLSQILKIMYVCPSKIFRKIAKKGVKIIINFVPKITPKIFGVKNATL